MKWKIPLFKIYSDEDDVEAVSNTIRKGMFWKDGEDIKKFEDSIKSYIGTKYALALNSGTSALHSLLLAYDVEGKEVVVPSFTFVSTVNAVELANAKPVFAEIENETFGLDVEDVKKRITDKTKAIIVVHYAGFPARDTEKLREFADKHNLILIEDAAESMGASINKIKVGTFGHAAMLSFCENKIITTGEGGAILTNDQDIYERCKVLRSHGRSELSDDYFALIKNEDFTRVGYNYRMPTKIASLGIAQIRKIDKLINMRRENARLFSERLTKIKGIKVINELDGHFSVRQIYTVFIEDENMRNKLESYLTEKGIMSKVYFTPVHLKTIYRNKYGFKEGDLPKTERISKHVLSLPFYPHIPREDIGLICDTIKEFFDNN